MQYVTRDLGTLLFLAATVPTGISRAAFEAVVALPPVIQRAGELAAAARRLFELIGAEPAVSEPRGRAAGYL